FRALENPPADPVRRPHAPHRQLAVCVVGFTEHPFLHHQGFPRALPGGGCQDGKIGGARRLGTGVAVQHAVVDLELARRAGRVSAQAARYERPCTASIGSRRRSGPVTARVDCSAQLLSSSPTAISPPSTTSP